MQTNTTKGTAAEMIASMQMFDGAIWLRQLEEEFKKLFVEEE